MQRLKPRGQGQKGKGIGREMSTSCASAGSWRDWRLDVSAFAAMVKGTWRSKRAAAMESFMVVFSKTVFSYRVFVVLSLCRLRAAVRAMEGKPLLFYTRGG